jgi:hypothetical protein
MIVAWAVFPLVLLAVCLGCGLLVERIAGWRLPGALLPSVGLALIVVVATLTTYKAATAPFTTATVVALALAGYVSSLPRVRALRLDPWALAAGLGVFAVLAAPVVLSGNASFLGYFVLNDTAVHFALIDQLLSHGRDISGLPYSSLSTTLQGYLATDYPLGSQVALGAVRPLVGQDVAWVFQPYLAVILALGAVALYQLLDGLTSRRALRALCAFVAAQPALVYAYYLEASVKELLVTLLITVIVVLVLLTLRAPLKLRRLAPLAVVTVAALDVLGVTVVPWIGLPLAVFAAVALSRTRATVRAAPAPRVAFSALGFVGGVALIAAPAIRGASTFFSAANGVLTRQGDLGNLVTPLIKWQVLGIWPSGDFRFPVITHYRIAYAIMGIAFASAVLGTIWAIRRRAAAPLLLLAGSGLASVYLLQRASPYAGAKVLAIFSLAAMLTAMLGSLALHDAGRRLEAWGLAAVLAGGVIWTNFTAYQHASVAPRARFQELGEIGRRFAGQGPALYSFSDEFSIHFLHQLNPTNTLMPLAERPGLPPRPFSLIRDARDTDELDQRQLQSFHLLVLGRSPAASRPPANYRLAYQGAYYQVWRRGATPRVLAHLALGDQLHATAVPSCRAVMSLAARAARAHARLAYVERPRTPTLVPTQALRPNNWGLVATDPYSLIPRQEPGSVVGTLKVEGAGLYRAWIESNLSAEAQLIVDGRRVGSISYQLASPGEYVSIGELRLSRGSHKVVVWVPFDDELAPGTLLITQTLGPLMLEPASDSEAVAQLQPARARRLCGRRLDWIEIVR